MIKLVIFGFLFGITSCSFLEESTMDVKSGRAANLNQHVVVIGMKRSAVLAALKFEERRVQRDFGRSYREIFSDGTDELAIHFTRTNRSSWRSEKEMVDSLLSGVSPEVSPEDKVIGLYGIGSE